MMTKKEPIVVGGQRIGKLKASWLLFKEAFRFFRADKEMIFIPLIMSAVNLFLLGFVFILFVLVVVGGDFSLSSEGGPATMIENLFIFSVYVVGAFTLALSQAAIVNTVYTRAHGEDATLMDSLKAAWSHSGSLFVWSLITSTVGILLRAIAERSRLLGALVVIFIGVSWSVLTYFVVPAMVIDKKSAWGSIRKSGEVFRKTWGETIVSNFGIGLVFFLIYLVTLFSMFGLILLATSMSLPAMAFGVVVLYTVLICSLILLQSALQGVIKTLLYLYASEGYIPFNFNQELIEGMIARKKEVSQQSTVDTEAVS